VDFWPPVISFQPACLLNSRPQVAGVGPLYASGEHPPQQPQRNASGRKALWAPLRWQLGHSEVWRVKSGGTFSCSWPTCSTPLFSSLYRTDLHDLPGDTMRSFALSLVLFLEITLTLASPSCRQSPILLHVKTKCKRNFQLFLSQLFAPSPAPIRASCSVIPPGYGPTGKPSIIRPGANFIAALHYTEPTVKPRAESTGPTNIAARVWARGRE
jgi:hypothetical protein